MGYYARWSGWIKFKENHNNDIRKELNETFRENYYDQRGYAEYSNSGNYDGQHIETILNKAMPFIDQAEMKYTGEDGAIWRFVIEDGVLDEQDGRVCYLPDRNEYIGQIIDIFQNELEKENKNLLINGSVYDTIADKLDCLMTGYGVFK